MPDLDWHRDWQRFHLRRTVESSRTTPLLCAHEWHEGRPVLPTPLLELPVQKPPVRGPACAPLEAQLDAGARRSVPFADRLRAVDFSDDKDAIALLGRRFGPERAISVTGIEAYRACAHRFYLERVLGLESRPEPQYEIDAAQWGSVIHAAMQRLYARGPVPLVRLADRARAALDSALREAELPRFWAETARRVFDNLLPSIVAIETELRERGWTPKETEHPVSGAAAPGILVRGRLDRLDSGPEGLRVLDYKTGAGSVSARTVIEDRTHVQLPLYARLIADELRQPVDNAGIYGLRDGRLRWLADTDHPLELLIRAALETTVEVVNGIRAGRFPAEPADERTCQRCDFGFLCRPSLAADD
jgi:RecB family exonuclease